jgi:hypothetical protein
MDSLNFNTALYPGSANLYSGAPLYQELESGYNPQTWINGGGVPANRVFKNSQYGQPYLYQLARSIRLQLRYTF